MPDKKRPAAEPQRRDARFDPAMSDADRELLGMYLDADDGAREAAEADRRIRQRVRALKAGHWVTRICAQGHVIENHRKDGHASTPTMRCPICGSPASIEEPEKTAQREHAAANSPMAKLHRMVDALTDWAQHHLDAKRWTEQSEIRRESEQKTRVQDRIF